MLPNLFGSRAVFFALGAGVAAALKNEKVKEGIRTLARETIKGGMILKNQVQSMAEKVKEDLEDITAEAQAELDAQKEKPASEDHS